MVKRLRKSVSAAEQSEMPGFIKPQLATLKSKAPQGQRWLHEPSCIADIEYRDITSEGLLRASSFKGLTEDRSKPRGRRKGG